MAAQADASAQTQAATLGQLVSTVDKTHLGMISRVEAIGAQIIYDGRMITIPVSTLSVVDGHVVTSLTKHDVLRLR